MIGYDEDLNAIYNPKGYGMNNFPKIGLMIFDDDSWEVIFKDLDLKPVINVKGKEVKDCFIYNYGGEDIFLCWSSCGAPVAAMEMEFAISSGVETILAFGTAGALDRNIKAREIIIPLSAFREEGTSYHYASDEFDELYQNKDNIDILKETIKERGLSFTEGKAWTTDAIFRETRGKLISMREKGCVCVDMECSALIAISAFRKIDFVQFLLAADNLDAENHESRAEDQKNNYDKQIIEVAMQTAIKIQRKRTESLKI